MSLTCSGRAADGRVGVSIKKGGAELPEIVCIWQLYKFSARVKGQSTILKRHKKSYGDQDTQMQVVHEDNKEIFNHKI